jgi:hypothetical protein
MYKYRNVKTGLEFESVTVCRGEYIEEVTEKNEAPKRKRPAKGAKKDESK